MVWLDWHGVTQASDNSVMKTKSFFETFYLVESLFESGFGPALASQVSQDQDYVAKAVSP